MTDRKLLQMALDALENAHANEPIWKTPIKEAIEALRARLAEPPKDLELPLVRPKEFVKLIQGKENYWGIPVMRTEWPTPEPVIQARKEGDLIVVDLPQVPRGSGGISKDERPDPVATQYKYIDAHGKDYWTSEPWDGKKVEAIRYLYASPQREWVGLTDEEINSSVNTWVRELVFELEVMLREKNNG